MDVPEALHHVIAQVNDGQHGSDDACRDKASDVAVIVPRENFESLGKGAG